MLNEKLEDGIIIATFEHGKTNSLTLEILRKLSDIVKKANEDDAVKGIVLTGAGRTFSSGFDLPMFMGFKDVKEIGDFFDEGEEILLALFECRKPVVSALNGHAIAGGLIFAMASDYRIVKNHPKISIGMSEIKLGLALTIAQS
jgi:enoyl-CoA hydratase/carnithine racemase